MSKKSQPENLFQFYADSKNQLEVASMLIGFGAATFKSALIIREIETLQIIKDSLESTKTTPPQSGLDHFAFEYLVDCIRILVFFENYMKAELIVNDFCVHNIDSSIEIYKGLAKQQKSRPIKLKEVHDIEPFTVNTSDQTCYHRGLKYTTLPFNVIIGKDYASYYKLDEQSLKFIKELADYRNNLHFNHKLEFSISQELIDNFKALNDFVDQLFKDYYKGV